jgi:hypothetical protein
MEAENRPDNTESLNETANNSETSENQNSVSNSSIITGDTNIQSQVISFLNSL